jgi:YD repeat-containing protein
MLTFNDKNVTYDANGNMTSVTNACGTTTYTWDARNRLIGIGGYKPDCSALTASFAYDALGRRTGKTVNGRTIQYLYDGKDIVQEIENGAPTVNYVRTLNIDEPLARIQSNGTVRYYQADALGSIIALTDQTGAIKTQYAYDAFGNVTMSGETSDNPFQYTGREDDGTGLYYYRAR